jgi:hypothetical protein
MFEQVNKQDGAALNAASAWNRTLAELPYEVTSRWAEYGFEMSPDKLQSAAVVGERSAFSKPNRRPMTPTFLSSADVTIDGQSTRWWGGLVFEPDYCGGKHGTWLDCPCDEDGSPVPLNMSIVKDLSNDDLCMPFLVKPTVAYESAGCGTLSGRTRDWNAMALDKLRRALPNTIAKTFYTGVTDRGPALCNPYLTSTLAPANILAAGTPVSPEYGVQALSAALSCCLEGLVGAIYVDPQTFEAVAHKLVRVGNGNQYFTHGGHIVIPSCSFDGRAPGTTVAPTGPTRFIYAAGQPSVQLSNPWSPQELDRQAGRVDNNGIPYSAHLRDDNGQFINEYRYLWEVTYATAFDPCCRKAIEVDLRANDVPVPKVC